MRFGIDASALGRPSPSGIRTILRHLVPQLARLLREDSLLLWQLDRRASRRPLPIPETPGVRHAATGIPPRALEFLWRRIDWPRIEAFTGPLDVFHSIQGRLPAARRTRLLLTLHDFRHRRLPELYPGVRWFPREIARADHFTADSEATRRDAIELLGIPPERITTIRWGPPPERPRLTPERSAEVLAQCGIEKPYIVCPSASDPRKNVAGAVLAHDLLRRRTGCPHRLVVVGELPPGSDAAWRRSAGDRVVLTGSVPDEEYFALLENAALSVQPSLNEGFGFPVLEAFQAGVPQAVALGSSLPEVAGPAALTFDPRDPEAMARAMERLIAEPALAERLVALGRERLGGFSWERSARETLALYRLLGARRRARVFRGAPAHIR